MSSARAPALRSRIGARKRSESFQRAAPILPGPFRVVVEPIPASRTCSTVADRPGQELGAGQIRATHVGVRRTSRYSRRWIGLRHRQQRAEIPPTVHKTLDTGGRMLAHGLLGLPLIIVRQGGDQLLEPIEVDLGQFGRRVGVVRGDVHRLFQPGRLPGKRRRVAARWPAAAPRQRFQLGQLPTRQGQHHRQQDGRAGGQQTAPAPSRAD